MTHDQINSALSSEEVNSEQIEDVLARFSGMGVNVVETEEASEEGEESREGEDAREEADKEAESDSGDLKHGRYTADAIARWPYCWH